MSSLFLGGVCVSSCLHVRRIFGGRPFDVGLALCEFVYGVKTLVVYLRVDVFAAPAPAPTSASLYISFFCFFSCVIFTSRLAGWLAAKRLLMSVIKGCLKEESKELKKLVMMYWEVVKKYDAEGKLLPEMILVCMIRVAHDGLLYGTMRCLLWDEAAMDAINRVFLSELCVTPGRGGEGPVCPCTL